MLYNDAPPNGQDYYPAIFTASKKYNINKVRGSYSRTAKNPNPSYEVPESHTERLPFIKDIVTLSQKRDVTTSDIAMYTRAIGERKKHFYRDGANSIRALFSVFCEHVNLVTHQIEISLRNASDAAGLSTISDNELKKAAEDSAYVPVVSISRASRAFRKMIKLGWIVAPNSWQVWDKERGHWIDKYFEATPLFFEALGITAERVEKQQSQRLAYLKKQALGMGMTPEMVGRMSITQIKAERKIAWRRNAFDRRAKEQARKKTTAQLRDRSRGEQRTVAIRNVLKSLGSDIHNTSAAELTDLTNKEIATLRKFSGLKPPLH